MGLLIASTAGLVLWIVVWALGAKGFDAFMMTLTIVVLAAMGRALMGYLPGRRPPD